MRARSFSLACALFPLLLPLSLSLSVRARILFLVLACSFVRSLLSLVRSFVVPERYCDKYLSRRRATLMRKKSKKPIDYLSFSSLSLTAD
jgi:hypothetical protein